GVPAKSKISWGGRWPGERRAASGDPTKPGFVGWIGARGPVGLFGRTSNGGPRPEWLNARGRPAAWPPRELALACGGGPAWRSGGGLQAGEARGRPWWRPP